jgi:hypothetical protein
VALSLVTFVIGQGILMNTNLNVQKLGLEQQVDSVAKCMKKIKGIGEDTGSFNPKEFYLMGHSLVTLQKYINCFTVMIERYR